MISGKASCRISQSTIFLFVGLLLLLSNIQFTHAQDGPTPTPVSIQGKPIVLWIMRGQLIPGSNEWAPIEYNIFQQSLSNWGAEQASIISGTQPIFYELLQPYSAVIFGDLRVDQYGVFKQGKPLSEEEQKAVVRYVNEGGSILVIGQQVSKDKVELPALYATSITKPFGVEFTTEISGTYKDFVKHILLTDVYRLMGTGGSKLLVNPPAQVLGRADSGEAVLASAEVGLGRVVAYTDEMPFDTMASNDIHLPFLRNLSAWLLHKENEIPTPTPTPTPVPGSPEAQTWDLLRKVFEANQPWLSPKSINAHYDIVRHPERVMFSVDVEEGGTGVDRVGAGFYTPLHILYYTDIPYQLELIGPALYNEIPVTVFDATLRVSQSGEIRIKTSKTSDIVLGTGSSKYRFYIDSNKSIPLYIEALNESQNVTSKWIFSPEYFSLDSGYASSRVELQSSSANNSICINFQVVEDVWIFSWGSMPCRETIINNDMKLSNFLLKPLTLKVNKWSLY